MQMLRAGNINRTMTAKSLAKLLSSKQSFRSKLAMLSEFALPGDVTPSPLVLACLIGCHLTMYFKVIFNVNDLERKPTAESLTKWNRFESRLAVLSSIMTMGASAAFWLFCIVLLLFVGYRYKDENSFRMGIIRWVRLHLHRFMPGIVWYLNLAPVILWESSQNQNFLSSFPSWLLDAWTVFNRFTALCSLLTSYTLIYLSGATYQSNRIVGPIPDFPTSLMIAFKNTMILILFKLPLHFQQAIFDEFITIIIFVNLTHLFLSLPIANFATLSLHTLWTLMLALPWLLKILSLDFRYLNISYVVHLTTISLCASGALAGLRQFYLKKNANCLKRFCFCVKFQLLIKFASRHEGIDTLISQIHKMWKILDLNNEPRTINFFQILGHSTNCADPGCFCWEIIHDNEGSSFRNPLVVRLFLKQLFQVYLRKNQNDYFVRLIYAEFLLNFENKPILSLTELSSFPNKLISSRDRLLQFSIRQEVHRRWVSQTALILSNNEKDLEIIRFVEIADKISDLKDHSEELVVQFFKLIARFKSPSFTPEKAKSLIAVFSKTKHKYLKIVQKIKNRYLPPLHGKIMDLCIPEEENRERLINPKLSKLSQANFVQNQSFCFLIVSLSKNELGTILKADSKIKGLLGFEPSNLVNSTLSSILPPEVGDEHQKSMEDFIQTNSSEFNHHEKGNFLMCKEDGMRGVEIYIKPFVNIQNYSACLFTAVDGRKSTDQALICDHLGSVLAVTKDFYNKTNWRFREAKKNSLIISLIPEAKSILEKTQSGASSSSLGTDERLKYFEAFLYVDFIALKNHGSIENKERSPQMLFEKTSQYSVKTILPNLRSSPLQVSPFQPNLMDMPVKKFCIKFTVQELRISSRIFYCFDIPTIKPKALPDSITNQKVITFVFRISLLKIFIRKVLKRKSRAIYQFMNKSVETLMREPSRKRLEFISQQLIPEKTAINLKSSEDNYTVNIQSLTKSIALRANKLCFLAIVTYLLIIGTTIVKMITLQSITADISTVILNSSSNIRLKNEMLGITVLFPHINSSPLLQSNEENSSQTEQGLEHLKSLEIDNRHEIDPEEAKMQNYFFDLQTESFLKKLKHPQYGEVSPNFSIKDLDSIAVHNYQAQHPFDVVSNVRDTFVYLNYLAHSSSIGIIQYANYRETSQRVIDMYHEYLETNVSFELLISNFDSIFQTLIFFSIALAISSFYALFKLTSSYLSLYRGLSFLTMIHVKKRHVRFLQNQFKYSKLENFHSESKNTNFHSVAFKHFKRPRTKDFLTFLGIFTFLLILGIVVMIRFVYNGVYLYRKTLNETNTAIGDLMHINFIVYDGIITLQNQSLPARISPEGFYQQITFKLDSMLTGNALMNQIVSELNLNKNLCLELAILNMSNCDHIMSGILKEGYKKSFDLIVHLITERLDRHQSWFLDPLHEEILQVIFGLTLINDVIQNAVRSAGERKIQGYRNTNILLLFLTILLLILLCVGFLSQLHRYLIRPWNHLAPLMKYLSLQVIRVNPELRKFLRGDFV